MNKTWEEFKEDFNSMTDEELNEELKDCYNIMDNDEEYPEDVVDGSRDFINAYDDWVAFGKPRSN